MSETVSGSGAQTGPTEGQDEADRQDDPGTVPGGLQPGYADQDGGGKSLGALGTDDPQDGRDAMSGMTAHQPPGDVDRDLDPLPDPDGHGPLSQGRDGQQFG
jgi:hypothetical protein